MTLELERRLHADIDVMQPNDLAEVVRVASTSEYSLASRLNFLERMDDDACDSFVARIEAIMVGYLTCYRDEDAGFATLDNMAVSPELRRCTIGSQLMSGLCSHLQSFMLIEEVTAFTAETNLGGQLFLKHCGFKCTEILPCDNWANCEAVYVMSRPLR